MKGYVILELSSWAGVSFGATHYYGKLIGYIGEKYTSHEVKHKMSAEFAVELSKKDDWSHYKEGLETNRFNNPIDVRHGALTILKEIFPDCHVLLEGNFAYAIPQKCIWSEKPEYKDMLNEVWKKYEDIPNIKINYPKQDVLWNKFRKLIEDANT
jgi:nitrous oxide reductase